MNIQKFEQQYHYEVSLYGGGGFILPENHIEAFRKALNTEKFVTVKDNTYKVSEIRTVMKKPIQQKAIKATEKYSKDFQKVNVIPKHMIEKLRMKAQDSKKEKIN